MPNIQRLLKQTAWGLAMLGVVGFASAADGIPFTMKVPVKITNLPNNTKLYVSCSVVLRVGQGFFDTVAVPVPVVNGNYQGTLSIPMHAEPNSNIWTCFLSKAQQGAGVLNADGANNPPIAPNKPQVTSVQGTF